MNRYQYYLLVLAISIMSACIGCAEKEIVQPPRLWGSLTSGPHGVGYTIVEHSDSTRSAQTSDIARPIQVVIWYPSKSSLQAGGSRYRDYYSLTLSQTTFQAPSESEIDSAIEQFIAFIGSNNIPESAAREWLSSPMAGVRGAEPADGDFPLILMAQGNFHSAYNQAVLSEYLASHGYIVATTPSPSLIDGPMEEDDSVFAYADQQARDLEAAIDVTRIQFDTGFDHIALVSHSFGARSAFLMPMRRQIDALVSLDGGIANRHGRKWLDGVEWDPADWEIPLLHLYQEGDSIVVPDFELIESLVAITPQVVQVDSIPHMGFSSLGFVAGAISGFTIGESAEDIGDRASEMVKATRLFLDAVLKDETVQHDWLTHGEWKYLRPPDEQP